MRQEIAQSYDACFLGLFRSPKGVGEAPRAKLTAARAVGLKIAAVNVPGIDDRSEFPGLDSMEMAGRSRKLAIFLNADNFVNLDECVPRRLRNGRHVIGEWYWELPRFPDAWLPAFDNADEIWVASEFVRRVMAKSTKKPVRVIPPMVEVVPANPEEARRNLGLPADAYIFLVAFDYQSFVARKNPDMAVRCFLDAFGSSRRVSDVLLVVKSHSSAYVPTGARLLRDLAEKNRNIRIIDRDFSRSEMGQLQSACDAYLSPHRSEGFGLNLAECMAHGKPVVATGFSGNVDFMTEANSFLAPWKRVRVKKGEYLHPEKQYWAEPDRDYFVETMRRLASDPRLGSVVGQTARADIARRFSRKAVGRMIKKNLLDR